MFGRVRLFIAKIVHGFWLVPTAMAVSGLIAAFVTVYFDETKTGQKFVESLPFLKIRVDGARSLVSTVAAGILTMASLLFSLTFVALTLMSQQLGPRIIQLMVRDNLSKFALGYFIAAFLYSIQVLAATGSGTDGEFTPYTSIVITVGAAIGAFFLMIFFIHHMANSIQADTLVARLSKDFDKAILSNFVQLDPEETSATSEVAKDDELFARLVSPYQRGKISKLKSPISGYVESIDVDAIITAAKENDWHVECACRRGHFVFKGEPVLRIFGNHRPELDTKEDESHFSKWFSFSERRSPIGEGEYEANALVEIALRALSPGLNDPYTAIACIDHLTDSLLHLLRNNLKSRIIEDDEGSPRLLLYNQGFQHFLDTAFHAIRSASSGIPMVLARLIRCCGILLGAAPRGSSHADAITAHLNFLSEAVEAQLDAKSDKKHLLKKIEEALQAPELNQSETEALPHVMR